LGSNWSLIGPPITTKPVGQRPDGFVTHLAVFRVSPEAPRNQAQIRRGRIIARYARAALCRSITVEPSAFLRRSLAASERNSSSWFRYSVVTSCVTYLPSNTLQSKRVILGLPARTASTRSSRS